MNYDEDDDDIDNEKLHEAVCKGNYLRCRDILENKRELLNKEYNKKYALCLACEQNNQDLVDLFIKNGANVNQLDTYDQSALSYAIDMASLEIVKLLVESGANINSSDINAITPLHVAINRKNDQICDYLIEAGAFINVIDKGGCTPLAMAVINDYVYMIFKLLDNDADPNISDTNGDTPLIKAIWSTMSVNIENEQIIRIVKALIKHGANVNAKNDNGRTALFTAIYQNNTDIALCLIENGADCEIENTIMSNFTLLHYACFQGNFVLAKALLEKNCNPNSLSSSGESPVYVAVTKGYLDIVNLLVDWGADLNIFIGSMPVNKCTVLQASVYYITDYCLFKQIVDKLIEGNVDLSVAVPCPILYICLQYNKINFAKYLLISGASIHQRTTFNHSCFYKAFLMKNFEFMRLCIMAGFSLKENEPWIRAYLSNPNFTDYTEYFVRRREDSSIVLDSDGNESEDNLDLADRTHDEDIVQFDKESSVNNEFRNLRFLDTQTNVRRNAWQSGLSGKMQNSEKNAKKIYSLLKFHYRNPLSLQELARIQIRNSLLKNDYKIKSKIEKELVLPKRLQDYLMFKEFNL